MRTSSGPNTACEQPVTSGGAGEQDAGQLHAALQFGPVPKAVLAGNHALRIRQGQALLPNLEAFCQMPGERK